MWLVGHLVNALTLGELILLSSGITKHNRENPEQRGALCPSHCPSVQVHGGGAHCCPNEARGF